MLACVEEVKNSGTGNPLPAFSASPDKIGGNGYPEELDAEPARKEPNTLTMLPGATGPATRLAALRMPPSAMAGAVGLLVPQPLAVTRLNASTDPSPVARS